ncbi:hypothetical protein [Haloparvum sedimenti]|uniref:hypothetical protein n=1 Tax=Haloparvum sedimenti TaxID=1678448 RepID=UPI001C3FFDCA|nr:hypothetical protein [Haloparvum sedimenti]
MLNQTTTETEQPTDCTQWIDNRTAICSVDLEGDVAVLELYSEGTQKVTLTEAMQGDGELARQEFLLTEGHNTIRFSINHASETVGVTIDTGDVLYGKIVEQGGTLVGGPWGVSDAQAAGAGGAVGVAVVTLLLVLKRVYGRDEHAERVA